MLSSERGVLGQPTDVAVNFNEECIVIACPDKTSGRQGYSTVGWALSQTAYGR